MNESGIVRDRRNLHTAETCPGRERQLALQGADGLHHLVVVSDPAVDVVDVLAGFTEVIDVIGGQGRRAELVRSASAIAFPVLTRGAALRGRDLDAANPGGYERPQPYRDLLSGGRFRESPDESFVEGADDPSIGVVGINPEGTVLDLDGHRPDSADGHGGSEGKALESVNDLMGRLLEGGVTEGTGHFPAPPGAFRFGRGGRSVTVCVSQQGDEAADEEPELGVAAEKRLAEAVTLGRPAPAGRHPRFLVEDAGVEQPFEMRPHGGGVNAEEIGQLRNLTGSLFKGLHDGQAPDVTQEPVALGPHGVRQPPIHLRQPP